ncbi:MAG: HD domain-containing protein [Bdellovibrionales bacterium]|nr:HD domain-containing protein [Bdellovibrionales bacterium]
MADQDDFFSIRVSTLRGDLKIPFDVYVKVGSKQIHYCRRGDSFEGARLDRLKSKKLKFMYIRSEDQPAYQQYLDASIDAAYSNNPAKPIEIRAEVIQGFQQATAEEYMDDPKDETSYKHVRSTVHRFVDFLDREPFGAAALLKLQNSDQSVTHHCVNVATLSTAMVLQNGLKEGTPLHLLALGCLLHDIEHYYNPEGFGRPLASLTPQEMEKRKAHPLAGAHRLQGALFVDQMVLNIITQHEEHLDGSGFPKGLTETDMDPLVMVAATANAYDRLVGLEGKAPKDALKTLLIDKLGIFPLPVLQNLQALLKEKKLV